MPPKLARPIYFLSLLLPPLRTNPPLPPNINPHPSLHHITLALFLSGTDLPSIKTILHSPALTPLLTPIPLRLGPISTFSRRGQTTVVYAECGATKPLPSSDSTNVTEKEFTRAQSRLALIRWTQAVRDVFISALPDGSVLVREDGGEHVLHVTLWKGGGRGRGGCPLDWKNLRVEEGTEEVRVGEITLCRVGSGGEEGYEVLDRRSLGGETVVEETPRQNESA